MAFVQYEADEWYQMKDVEDRWGVVLADDTPNVGTALLNIVVVKLKEKGKCVGMIIQISHGCH